MYGLHIIKYPTGRYGYVGSVPTVLATVVPANRSAVMGGRSFRGGDGKQYTHKWPVFETRAEAVEHAARFGFTLK